MTQRTQFDRAYTTGVEVSAPQPEGTPFVNFPDRRLQVQGPSGPIDLLAVRLHSEDAAYVTGDIVAFGGGLYSALVPVSPGPFDITEWANLVSDVFQPVLGAYGWNFALTYTGVYVTEVLSSLADNQLRQTIGYDANEYPATFQYEQSTDGGQNWALMSTLTITYDADGNPLSGAWS
jgi:hypothetical protein